MKAIEKLKIVAVIPIWELDAPTEVKNTGTNVDSKMMGSPSPHKNSPAEVETAFRKKNLLRSTD
jgi:hypothetical protein